MSGRMNYRKTGRRVVQRHPRTPEHQLADKRLSFMLPPAISPFVSVGQTRVAGVRVSFGGQVEVFGKNRDWLIKQAATFLQAIAKGKGSMTISATLETPDEPPLTEGAPARRGGRDRYQFAIVTGDPAVVVSGGALEPTIFASRMVA